MTRHLFAAALALAPLAAPAATFDFGDLAEDTRANLGRETTWSEAMPNGWTADGITVQASPDAWLDGGFTSSRFTSAPAGLGLCNSPTGDCNASDWDGIRDAGERLSLMFSEVIDAIWTLRETTLAWHAGTAPDHTLMNGCARVNGTEYAVSDGLLSGLAPSAAWTFEPCAEVRSDFYVTAVSATPEAPAPVPVPASLGFLLAALGGLVAVRRARE